MSTFMANRSTVDPKWFVVDATDQVVGRLAVQIANIIRGKHKPEYTPHCDTGDFVVVINAEKIKFTGRKWEQKSYQTFSGYAGGQKIIPAAEMLQKAERPLILVGRTTRGEAKWQRRVQLAETLGAVTAASCTYLPPLVALVIGLAVGEKLDGLDVLAMVLILAGVATLQTANRKTLRPRRIDA